MHSLIKNTKEFTVYKVPGSSKDPIDLQQGSKHGSFFPFNTLGDHKYWGIPQISEKSPDFHFGMTMSAKFIQPKDGKINGNNMVFEFLEMMMYGFTSMAFWCWILVVFIMKCLVLLILLMVQLKLVVTLIQI